VAHGKPPQFAILNHAAVDSGIPRESATQRIGIRSSSISSEGGAWVEELNPTAEKRLSLDRGRHTATASV
jgi:hypothetical protein